MTGRAANPVVVDILWNPPQSCKLMAESTINDAVDNEPFEAEMSAL